MHNIENHFFLVPYPVSDEIKQVVLWQHEKDENCPNDGEFALVKTREGQATPSILKEYNEISHDKAKIFGKPTQL